MPCTLYSKNPAGQPWDGTRINAIVPGAVETLLLARGFARSPVPDAAREASRRRHPMGRFGRAEEVAGAALHLASGAVSLKVGTELMVDGGWLAGQLWRRSRSLGRAGKAGHPHMPSDEPFIEPSGAAMACITRAPAGLFCAAAFTIPAVSSSYRHAWKLAFLTNAIGGPVGCKNQVTTRAGIVPAVRPEAPERRTALLVSPRRQ